MRENKTNPQTNTVLYYNLKKQRDYYIFKKSNMVLGDGWLGKNGALQAWAPEIGLQ